MSSRWGPKRISLAEMLVAVNLSMAWGIGIGWLVWGR